MQATLSHYRILEQIGRGGMGVVYRAHDEHLDCDVALKVLPAGELADDSARKRFRKEALALSKLNHPNIAVVHDFDTQDGTDFLVEELIPGLSLDQMLVAGPLPEREIIHLGAQLAEGLAAAHHRGVIHRDLKPANIRVTPDARLKILDFGLAKVLGAAVPAADGALTVSLSETRTLAGTLPYMAPEQLLNQKLDTRTDIWAAGCVLYEMATGRRPFFGSGPALVDAILHRAPATPTKLNHQVSTDLEAIILKCLEKEPALRYADAREIAVDLHRLAATASAILPAVRPRYPGMRRYALAAALLVIAAAIAPSVYRSLPRQAVPPAHPAPGPSIAVLPFIDMSPGKDKEYFADGLAEELLNSLARTPGLRVVARTSSFQFKGRNAKLADIARELNVATILEGSVRSQGKRVRITAQLINASDGFHLWSDTYDRELTDIFTVQEEIARSVAGALRVALLGLGGPSTHGTSDEAFDAYLQGRYFYQHSSQENLARAVSYYQQAVKLDSRYGPAWVGLAEAYSRQADWGYLPAEDGYRKARDAAGRSLALDANSAEAHAAMGLIQAIHDWDWLAADASYRRALVLQPGNAVVVSGAAVLALAMGRRGGASALCRQAVELDPLNSQIYVYLGVAEYYAGHHERAIVALNKALTIDPQRQYAHTLLGQVYLAQSHREEALVEVQREPDANLRLFGLTLAYFALGRRSDSDTALSALIAKYGAVSAFQIAEAYSFRGQADPAFAWLERAYAQRDGGLVWFKGDPLLKNLQSHPLYAAFLKKMRLPPD